MSDDLLPRPGLGALALDQREVGVRPAAFGPRGCRASRNMPAPLPKSLKSAPETGYGRSFHYIGFPTRSGNKKITAENVENQRFSAGSAREIRLVLRHTTCRVALARGFRGDAGINHGGLCHAEEESVVRLTERERGSLARVIKKLSGS